MDEFSRITVLANPRAGSVNRGFVQEIGRLCATLVPQVDIAWTAYRGHALELARECGRQAAVDGGESQALVVLGGDGTLREAVAGLLDSEGADPAVIVLPGGTGNSNYRSLWNDVPWREAVMAALTGVGVTHRRLDVAVMRGRGRLVVLGASTGVFAELTAAAPTIAVTGRSRYQTALGAVLPSFLPYPGRVIVDGAVVHEGKTNLVNVGFGQYRAGVFHILPRSVRDDGLLDVCVIDEGMPVGHALDLMRTADHLGCDGVFYSQGRSITVERTDGLPLLFEHDGEVVATQTDSFTLDVIPRRLSFVVAA